MGSDTGSSTPTVPLLPQLAESTGHLMWRAAARVDQSLAEVLPVGVDVHAYAVLVALGDDHAQSQQWLADAIGVSRTTMTKVAVDLVARGLVERVRNPADRRSYSLTRTGMGAEAATAWGPHVRAVKMRLLDGLEPGERAELHRLLLTVAEPLLSPTLWPELVTRTGFLIARMHARMHADMMVALRDLGLEPRHLGSLIVLTTTGPVAQADLARHLGVSGATVVEIADHLEQAGLVERRRLETDRRTQSLHLLPGAAETAHQARQRSDAVTAVLLASLSAAERRRLTVLLARFVTAG